MSGITNPKNNTCYCSSTIQMLAASPIIRANFITHEEQHILQGSGDTASCLVCLVSKTMKYIKEKNKRAYAIKHLAPVLSDYQGARQDAQEFLANFINSNHPDIRSLISVPVKKYLTCVQCQDHRESATETDIIISMTQGTADSIQEALSFYFGEHVIEHFFCNACQKYAPLAIETILQDYPPNIVLHNVDGHSMIVDEILDFFEYQYRLLGLVLIQGFSDEERHYTCVRKYSGTWHLFNDNRVEPFKLDKQTRYPAYLLIYEKMYRRQQPSETSASVFPASQARTTVSLPKDLVSKPSRKSETFGSERQMKEYERLKKDLSTVTLYDPTGKTSGSKLDVRPPIFGKSTSDEPTASTSTEESRSKSVDKTTSTQGSKRKAQWSKDDDPTLLKKMRSLEETMKMSRVRSLNVSVPVPSRVTSMPDFHRFKTSEQQPESKQQTGEQLKRKRSSSVPDIWRPGSSAEHGPPRKKITLGPNLSSIMKKTFEVTKSAAAEAKMSSTASKDSSSGQMPVFISYEDETTGFKYINVLDENGNLSKVSVSAISQSAKDPEKEPDSEQVETEPVTIGTIEIKEEVPDVPVVPSRFLKSPKDLEIAIPGSPLKVKMLSVPLGRHVVESYIRKQKKDYDKFEKEQLNYIAQNTDYSILGLEVLYREDIDIEAHDSQDDDYQFEYEKDREVDDITKSESDLTEEEYDIQIPPDDYEITDESEEKKSPRKLRRKQHKMKDVQVYDVDDEQEEPIDDEDKDKDYEPEEGEEQEDDDDDNDDDEDDDDEDDDDDQMKKKVASGKRNTTKQDEEFETINVRKQHKRRPHNTSKRASAEKRVYNLVNWKIPKGGVKPHHVHDSMYEKGKKLEISKKQMETGQCLLCGDKVAKRFYTGNLRLMAKHYKQRHTKTVHQADHGTPKDSKTFFFLRCKCDDIVSRQQDCNRNVHFHCPWCWKPDWKAETWKKHQVTEHFVDADSIVLDVDPFQPQPEEPKSKDEDEDDDEEEREEDS